MLTVSWLVHENHVQDRQDKQIPSIDLGGVLGAVIVADGLGQECGDQTTVDLAVGGLQHQQEIVHLRAIELGAVGCLVSIKQLGDNVAHLCACSWDSFHWG